MVKYRNADGVSHHNSVIIYNYTSIRIKIMYNVGTTYISILEDWSELLGRCDDDIILLWCTLYYIILCSRYDWMSIGDDFYCFFIYFL